MKDKLNTNELKKNKKTVIISTEEALKDIEPFYTFDELLEFIETAPTEVITELLKKYNVKFEDNDDKEQD